MARRTKMLPSMVAKARQMRNAASSTFSSVNPVKFDEPNMRCVSEVIIRRLSVPVCGEPALKFERLALPSSRKLTTEGTGVAKFISLKEAVM
jgi:hypothetical protein